jgi:hypothetical protein
MEVIAGGFGDNRLVRNYMLASPWVRAAAIFPAAMMAHSRRFRNVPNRIGRPVMDVRIELIGSVSIL